jgi:glycosyltransferase involved in cell wall biosynthesis
MDSGAAKVLFVNAGILGLGAYHAFLQEALPKQSRIRGELLLLPEHLSTFDRILRRILTLRVWRDSWPGGANLDLARLRAELNTGLHARRLVASAQPERFDVLFFHRQSAAWGCLDLMSRIPSIVSIDATQDAIMAAARTSLEGRTYAVNARIDGAVYRRAAAIVSTSQWAADCVRARYPEARAPIHVLPPPVALQRFDPAWMDKRRARARRGAKPHVLFVGGDFPRKGGPELLAAWSAGGFASRASLELVTDWPVAQLPAGVTLRRGVAALSERWLQCWREADLFVMPTRNEAFGLVYQEAAAAGLPAIGTRHNAVPEIIDDGTTGLLVPPADVPALTRALADLIEDVDARDRMGRAARARIERLADPSRHLDQLADIVDAVRRPPSSALR